MNLFPMLTDFSINTYVILIHDSYFCQFIKFFVDRVKYIEEELQKRKKNNASEKDDTNLQKTIYCVPEEAALQAVPDYLRRSSSHKNEEMLSNQMLSGIPEVDLGIEYGLNNFYQIYTTICEKYISLKNFSLPERKFETLRQQRRQK